MKHKLVAWIMRKLPPIFAYHGAIEVVCIATTGEWSHQIVPDLSAMDAVKRFSDFHGGVDK